MTKLDPLIDAYLAGDTLFRFVYKPATEELFLEDELDERDNGQFVYVPFKDARELYLEMADFTRMQAHDTEPILYAALCSPSPIDKFQHKVEELGLADSWNERKRAYGAKQIQQWLKQFY